MKPLRKLRYQNRSGKMQIIRIWSVFIGIAAILTLSQSGSVGGTDESWGKCNNYV